jgi:hypothetical protein
MSGQKLDAVLGGNCPKICSGTEPGGPAGIQSHGRFGNERIERFRPAS